MTVDKDVCDHCNPYVFETMVDPRYYQKQYIADSRESHKASNEKGVFICLVNACIARYHSHLDDGNCFFTWMGGLVSV